MRPPATDSKLKDDRVRTSDRFSGKLPTELSLFIDEQQRRRQQNPELEESMREEEARAKHKIDELHKNYYALLASSELGSGASVGQAGSQKPKRSLMRSEDYAFTTTGTYRP